MHNRSCHVAPGLAAVDIMSPHPHLLFICCLHHSCHICTMTSVITEIKPSSISHGQHCSYVRETNERPDRTYQWGPPNSWQPVWRSRHTASQSRSRHLWWRRWDAALTCSSACLSPDATGHSERWPKKIICMMMLLMQDNHNTSYCIFWRQGLVVDTWLWDQEVPGSSPGCARSTCISSPHLRVKWVTDYRQYARVKASL